MSLAEMSWIDGRMSKRVKMYVWPWKAAAILKTPEVLYTSALQIAYRISTEGVSHGMVLKLCGEREIS